MRGSTVPDVIDYLLAKIAALPECAAPVRVSDGYVRTDVGQAVVAVAGFLDDTEPTSVDLATQYGPLGTGAVDESYAVGVYVDVAQNTTQKAVRDATFVIVDAIVAALRADLNLGGLLGPYALRLESRMQQTDSTDAAEVSRCTVLLSVQCQARI